MNDRRIVTPEEVRAGQMLKGNAPQKVKMRMQPQNGMVLLQFNLKVGNLVLPAEQAFKMGKQLIKNAKKAQKQVLQNMPKSSLSPIKLAGGNNDG